MAHVYCNCTKGPLNYIPSFDNQGDPKDCRRWSINVTFASDARDCIFLPDTVSTTDYILLCISCLIWIIVIILMINKCKYINYPAIHLETYQKILQMNGFGMYYMCMCIFSFCYPIEFFCWGTSAVNSKVFP